jgi:hypothetical protein
MEDEKMSNRTHPMRSYMIAIILLAVVGCAVSLISLFEDQLGLSRTMKLLVILAQGATGLAGLVLGAVVLVRILQYRN